MRSFLFLVISVLFISLNGCGDDNDGGGGSGSPEDKQKYAVEYAQVLDKITKSEIKLATLQEEAKGSQGGRQLIIQEQISREIATLSDLRRRKSQLEGLLGLK